MEPDLGRLAARVTKRRLRLNLSIKRAAALADGMAKDTWTRVEDGKVVRHETYDRVESALGWTVGSCRKVMDGGEPSLLADNDAVAVVPPEDLEVEVRGAVQGALIATTDELTAAQIRDINERAIGILRQRGVLPPEG